MWRGINGILDKFKISQDVQLIDLHKLTIEIISQQATEESFNSQQALRALISILHYYAASKGNEPYKELFDKCFNTSMVEQGEVEKLIIALLELRSKVIEAVIRKWESSDLDTKLALFKIKRAIERSGKIELSIKGEIQNTNPEKLEKLLNRFKDFALLGDPGSGKSWGLARYFENIRIHNYHFSSIRFIPCFLAVSEVIKILNASSNVEEKIEYSTYNVLRHMLLQHPQNDVKLLANNWIQLKTLADAGAFFFIFDGLNEVERPDRKRFSILFNNLRKDFGANRFCIACRTIHWDGSLFADLRPVIKVPELSDDEVRSFIALFLDDFNKTNSLIHLLYGHGSEATLGKLRKVPFFLDKIVRVYQTRGKIPANRGDLFKDFLSATANDRNWFDLQQWMLGMVGLYMTYKSGTNFDSQILSKILYLGYLSAPSLNYSTVTINIPAGFSVTRKVYDNIASIDTIMEETDGSNEILAGLSGKILSLTDNMIKIEQSALLELNYSIRKSNDVIIHWDNSNANDSRIAEPKLLSPDLVEIILDTMEFLYQIPQKSIRKRVGNLISSEVAQIFNAVDNLITNQKIDKNSYLDEIHKNINSNLIINESTTLWESHVSVNSPSIALLEERFQKRYEGEQWYSFLQIMKLIQENAFFSKDEIPQFQHQSIQEYFAALHFSRLYSQDETCLNTFLKNKNFDEMFHIVIGCVFEENKEVVKKILYMMVNKFHIVELESTLSNAEHIEPETKYDLTTILYKIIEDVKCPDEARAAAINSLPFLINENDQNTHLSFFAHTDLEEGEVSWRALLKTTLKWFQEKHNIPIKTNDNLSPNELYHIYNEIANDYCDYLIKAIFIRKRRESIIIGLSNWIREMKYFELHKVLVNEFIFFIHNFPQKEEVINSLWYAMKESKYSLDYFQWKSCLAEISNCKLYAELIEWAIYNHAEFSNWCREYLDEVKIGALVKRLCYGDNEDWYFPLISLTKVPLDLKIQNELAQNILGACLHHKSFPKELLSYLWKLPEDVIINLEIDIETLQNAITLDSKHRASYLGTFISEKVSNASTDFKKSFIRNMYDIVTLAYTDDNELSDSLLNVLRNLAVNLKADSGLLELISRFDKDIIISHFSKWESLIPEDQKTLAIAARINESKFKNSDFFNFLQKDPHARLFVLLYIGKGSDRFIKEFPGQIKIVFPEYGVLKDEAISVNYNFIKNFSEFNSDFSTRVIIYQSLHNSRRWALQSITKNPTSHNRYNKDVIKRGSNDFKSLVRLLENYYLIEAALLLSARDYSGVEGMLPARLRENLKAAEDHMKNFVENQSSKHFTHIALENADDVDKFLDQTVAWSKEHFEKILRLVFLRKLDACFEKLINELNQNFTSAEWQSSEDFHLDQYNLGQQTFTDQRQYLFWWLKENEDLLGFSKDGDELTIQNLTNLFNKLPETLYNATIKQLFKNFEEDPIIKNNIGWCKLRFSIIADALKKQKLHLTNYSKFVQFIIELASDSSQSGVEASSVAELIPNITAKEDIPKLESSIKSLIKKKDKSISIQKDDHLTNEPLITRDKKFNELLWEIRESLLREHGERIDINIKKNGFKSTKGSSI